MNYLNPSSQNPHKKKPVFWDVFLPLPSLMNRLIWIQGFYFHTWELFIISFDQWVRSASWDVSNCFIFSSMKRLTWKLHSHFWFNHTRQLKFFTKILVNWRRSASPARTFIVLSKALNTFFEKLKNFPAKFWPDGAKTLPEHQTGVQ